MVALSRLGAGQKVSTHPFSTTPLRLRTLARPVPGPRIRGPSRRPASMFTEALLGFDTFFPAMGVAPEVAVFGSALLATSSVVINFFSGVQLEQKRAELALELERDKTFQVQLRELQGVIARYRGPLLESAIDLEQRLWHLITDQCFDQRAAEGIHEEVRYLLFTFAQFLGFIEVVRREGPRERPFLQAGNPQGSDTLSTMVEGIRFVLCASPDYLEDWYLEGTSRTHPGARLRRSREEVIQRHEMLDSTGCEFMPEIEPALLRISRGHQRAIGTMMIITQMGAERHYTMSYGEFHDKLETCPNFKHWFSQMEADAVDLATGNMWRGEGPFPVGRFTRVLLLQQLLVELMDLLDPDCVRLPLDRRQRLMPINWGKLPRVSEYRQRLKDLSKSSESFGRAEKSSALEGLKDLVKGSTVDEPPLTSSLRSNVSIDYEGDTFAAYQKTRSEGMTVATLEQREALEAKRAEERAAALEKRLVGSGAEKNSGK